MTRTLYQIDVDGFLTGKSFTPAASDDIEADIAQYLTDNPDFVDCPIDTSDGLKKRKHDNGAWVEGATQAELDGELDGVKKHFKKAIDNFTDQWRSNFVTKEIVQQLIYEKKRHEAELVEADASKAGTAETAVLNKQVEKQSKHNGKSVAQAVQDEVAEILALRAVWEDEAGRSEGIRLDAKEQIDAATTEAAMQTIYDQFVTDMQSGS